ncbi:hypothetical protein [Streptomyces sp. NPDC005573]|uniref:hypothetical protein n=1 Tax=Streptomyces sp. NPDC005573 TaxID=3156890 RepID=UPI0033BDA056
MDQRIGSSSQPLKGEPVKGAGFDPAFIPGITSPVKAAAPGPEDAEPAGSADPVDAVEPASAGEARVDATDASEASDASDASDAAPVAPAADVADTPGAADEAVAAGESEETAAPDGPVFEAADRRARIVADHRGVRLSLDDESCEFRWSEIAAVETESPRFGKRFTVTVHTPERRWYPIEIEATARSRFKEWESELDAVLDAYFEEA